MHILEIPSFFTPYGGEFCLEQARALKARGHEVRILSNVQLSIRRSVTEFVMLPYFHFWEDNDGIEAYRNFQRGIPKLADVNAKRWVNIVKQMFDEYVKQYGLPDVLHAHCAKWAGYAALLISRERHIPYVITEHMPLWNYEQEFGTAPSSAWQVDLLRETYKQTACVICVSEEHADDLAAYIGCDFRSKFISNLIDTDFFYCKERKRAEGEPFRFVCPAVFMERKGYDVLLSAFEKMKHDNVELHVAGSGTDSKEFNRLLSACSAANKVVAHGDMDRKAIRELLWKCHAVALATRGEVQPLVLLEGMSTGLPYVSTTVVPRCERFDDSCRVVPVDDVDAFAKAMDEMVESKVDGSILSQHVKEMAALEVVSHQIESVLIAAVNNQPA